MSHFHPDILKRNIKDLMSNNGITQQQLAEILCMSQSNISKALNENEKKSFTLEQVYNIATHFNISIDALCGNSMPELVNTGPRAIASFISHALEQGDAKYTAIEIEENVFEIDYNARPYPDCVNKRKMVKYPAFYFPDYFDPFEGAKSDEEYQERYSEVRVTGNDTKNILVNEFFRKYIPICNLYRKKELAEDAYLVVLKDFLSRVPDH